MFTEDEWERIDALLSPEEIDPPPPDEDEGDDTTIEEEAALAMLREICRRGSLRQRDAANLLDKTFGAGRLVHRTDNAKRSIDKVVRKHFREMAGNGLTYDKKRRVWHL